MATGPGHGIGRAPLRWGLCIFKTIACRHTDVIGSKFGKPSGYPGALGKGIPLNNKVLAVYPNTKRIVISYEFAHSLIYFYGQLHPVFKCASVSIGSFINSGKKRGKDVGMGHVDFNEVKSSRNGTFGSCHMVLYDVGQLLSLKIFNLLSPAGPRNFQELHDLNTHLYFL